VDRGAAKNAKMRETGMMTDIIILLAVGAGLVIASKLAAYLGGRSVL
jgi:hypothetical protein